jgi:putative transposase
LRRIYVPFLIEISTRRVDLADMTESPGGAWVAQPARNLAWGLQEREHPVRFLLRDNDAKFRRAFDDVFRTGASRSSGLPSKRPGKRDPERFVGTARRERLDWILIVNQNHLERVLQTFVDHYNGRRPHRGLGLAAPSHANVVPLTTGASNVGGVSRCTRLGGLINE